MKNQKQTKINFKMGILIFKTVFNKTFKSKIKQNKQDGAKMILQFQKIKKIC